MVVMVIKKQRLALKISGGSNLFTLIRGEKFSDTENFAHGQS